MSDKLIIPGSIIIAGVIIGIAVYLSGGSQSPSPDTDNNQQVSQASNIRIVDSKRDRISGNPKASLFIIEYSDLECPFCKRYHDKVLPQLKETYADSGDVAFVFRHFPLDEPYTRPLHPTATEEAIASECVAHLGGNDAFFSFIDSIFATTASDGQYDLSTLPNLAAQAGVDRASFTTCFENKDTEGLVSEDFQNGVSAGVQGTPTIFIQTAEGKTYQAVADYNALRVAIDAYLSDK
ncbi:MAG: DsbA family protein [Patescibacteria group bacterium]